MASTVSVLIANEPGKVVEMPYRMNEPIFFLLQRLASQLGHETTDLQQHRLCINGFPLCDDKKSLDEYRIYGSSLTYKFWPVGSIRVHIKTLTQKTLDFCCHPADTVLDLKKKIREADGIPLDQQRIIFAGVQLEESRSLDEYNIINDSVLFLVLRLRGGGAEPTLWIGFSDVSDKSNVRKVEFSTEAPRGRTVYPGTNIECRCACTPGYNVICRKSFSVIELTKEKFLCPNCHKSHQIIPVTVGFTNCQYRFMGIKNNGEQHTSEWVDVPPEAKYQLFDSSKQTTWRRLMIQSKLREEKDDCVVCLGLRDTVKAFPCGHHFHEACYAKVGWCFTCRFDQQLRVTTPN